MGGREKSNVFGKLQLPGPGAYDGVYTVVMRKPPMYSIRFKYNEPNDSRFKPGPGAHCPEKHLSHKSAPAPSFAIHHSPYSGLRKAFHMPKSYAHPPIMAWCCNV